MRCTLFLIFILILINTASAITQTKNIENFSWEQGTDLDNALELNDYFSSDETLTYTYNIADPTTDISPIEIEIADDSVNFKSTSNPSWTGEKYIVFIAHNSTGDLTSNKVMLNVTKKISSTQNPSDLSITSFSPSTEKVEINLYDTQVFSITVNTTENVTVGWYINNELKKQSSEKSFSYLADTLGTISIKVKVKLGAKSVDHSWTAEVKEKASPESEVEGSSKFVEKEPVCGNQIKEEGENCETCPEDVKCAANADCINGICVPKPQKEESSFLKILIIISIIVVILGGMGFGIFFMYKKGLFSKFKKKPTEEIQKPPETKKLDISVLKNYLQENLKKGFKLEDLKKAALGKGWSLEDIKKALPVSKIEPLKNYIKENLKKEYTRQQLEEISIKTGWTKEQFDQAFNAVKNDNTQRNPPTDRKLP